MGFVKYVPGLSELTPNERLATRQGFSSVSAYEIYRNYVKLDKPLYQLFSHLVRTRLESKGLSGAEAARQLGRNKATVARYARGVRVPRTDEEALEIFEFLDLPYTSMSQLEACVRSE